MLQEASGAAGHPSYRRYHYGNGPLLVEDGGTRRFISTDALGSTTDLTTTGGSVSSMRKYDAWGQYRNDTAPSANEPKLGFTGHQYDPETGLVYARARYYDPDLGRFLSRDSVEGTIGDAPSLHRFMYVRGNPLRYTDPTGHCAVNKDGTVNCLAPAMAMQRQFTSRMSAAWAKGNYGKAAYNLLLATANTVSVAAGAAAQLVVGTAYNAGYDASAGFSTGDYDRALRGSTELLMVAGGEHVMKGAQWVEETAAPAVKKVVTQAAEDLTTKLAPEVAGAERAAVTEAVEQATKPGTAQVAANEVGAPKFRSLGAAAKGDPALGGASPAPEFSSPDPLVGDLANKIEAIYPGHVVGVNTPVRDALGNLVTDLDIETANAVVQVKSGGGKGLAGQIQRTQGATPKPVIGYAPEAKTSVIKEAQKRGQLVTQDEDLLLEVLKPDPK